MSKYPYNLDDDTTLPRVDDNITETGQEAINAVRDAVFAIQETLGIEPNGSAGSIANRLDVSLDSSGAIKTSALASIGLVTLPITNSQIGSNAGIEESKLSLMHSTSDLYTLISGNTALINSLNSFTNDIFTDLNLHISGSSLLSDGSSAGRHVLSQIDLNSVPSDSRDPLFTWSGLLDKNGNLRSAVTAAEGLKVVNEALVAHENQVSSAHAASAISVDTDNFKEIPLTAINVQSALNYLDNSEVLNIGQHRATQHANGIPKISRSESLLVDGYGNNVIPNTTIYSYLIHPPNTTPVDDLSTGDDVIKFISSNTSNSFDAKFSQVKVGDIIRINYGNGIEASFPIESIRHIPGTEWLVRINGVNLCESTDGSASARIDRAIYDVDTAGIFAVATANARNSTGPTNTNILSSLIVANPKSAMALGLGFDANQLNSSHYNLYLELYPTGNPVDKVISLPAIDVTGNAGITPGFYTLSSVVDSINNKFREFGYNYRFIAFEYKGELGIMLADCINSASFAIISGDNSSGIVVEGTYTNNVVNLDGWDALGFGPNGSNIASPAYQSTWSNATAALFPTKLVAPLKKRYAIVNGIKLDGFADMYLANADGSWDGYVSSRTVVGVSTVETTYTVELYLSASGIRPGKTIVVQPAISFNNGSYSDVDYGRFIIKSVNYIGACGNTPAQTQITVINSIHGLGSAISSSADVGLPVKLYFSYDSVDFNSQNLIDSGSTSTDYKRFFEIYLSDSGKTFSHERLRAPIQNETANLLSTNNFHFVDVSSKLRGYTDGIPTTFNKYLRFYVLNYDANTGEFDGYLGQRVPSTNNVVKTGKVSKGKKNVISRFYDETNIDYIDVIFSDSTGSPGTAVMSTSSPRYVDLELFPSLQLDDELLLLSTCEVNWDPLSNENIIQYLTDKRQFGSVDESDFTDSAISFISAGNKYLHDCGVIRGLDYDTTATGGEIFFKGGSAIVNGKVISANNQSVVIPEIYPQGTSKPQTLNWAICLNEFGNLVPIILTSSKDIFFATTGSQNYQVNSATFDEITNERKDLCIIAIASVTIASITINSITDARKFVAGLDNAAPLVWSSGEEYLGNFYNFSALKAWLINSNAKNNYVKVRGEFSLSDSIDLTGFNRTVIIDGAESRITYEPSGLGKGFIIGSNVHLKNMNIRYVPTGITYTAGVTKNLGAGCIYFNGDYGYNIRIQDCNFESYDATQHPPFINFELNFDKALENVIISGNIFDAISEASSFAFYQAAISFTNLATVGTSAAVMKNITIKDNYSRYYHGIYLNVEDTLAPGTLVNAVIENNVCGNIGYFHGTDGVNPFGSNNSLIIRNNHAKLIATMVGNNVALDGLFDYAIGDTIIEGNSCNWIHGQKYENSTTRGHLLINNNILKGSDSSYLDNFYTGVYNNCAIRIYNDLDSTDMTPFIISNNSIDFGRDNNTTYGYDYSIRVKGNCSIIGNNIAGINSSQYGLYCEANGYAHPTYYDVEKNNFIRRSISITNYIYVNPTTTYGKVEHNTFDSTTVNGSSEELVASTVAGEYLDNWNFIKNKNQSYVISLTPNQAVSYLEFLEKSNFTGVTSTVQSTALLTNNFRFNYNDTSTEITCNWDIPINGIIPDGAYVYKIELTHSATVVPSTYSSIILRYDSSGGTANQVTASAWTLVSNTLTLNLTNPTDRVVKYKPSNATVSNRAAVSIFAVANGSATSILTMSAKLFFRF